MSTGSVAAHVAVKEPAQVTAAETVHASRLPALLVTADVLALAALVWLTGS